VRCSPPGEAAALGSRSAGPACTPDQAPRGRFVDVAAFLGVKAGQLGGGRAKLRGTIDVITLQTLARRDDIPELTAGYGLIVADECHHIPAAAFEDEVRQITARRWFGLTATPYRRDRLDDLIGMQVGPVCHTITLPRQAAGTMDMLPGSAPGGRGEPASGTSTPSSTTGPSGR
jgi:hypothetical protein